MFIFVISDPSSMEKKVLTTTAMASAEYSVPFLQIFALVVHIFLVTNWGKIIQKFVPRFKSFLQSKFVFSSSKTRAEKGSSSGDEKPVSVARRSFDDERDCEDLRREDVEIVMGKLGFFCSPESEGLRESLGRNEFSGLFDEDEPSLEEVKEAFDAFDANRDGFIDSKELQRVLRLLGLNHRSEIGDCERMIKSVDKNRDGRIDFHEFVKFMENIFC